MRRVLMVLGGLVALVCGAMVLIALVMTVTDGTVTVTVTDTPGAVDRRMTEAFADVATAGPGTPTRTPLPTTDPTQMWLEVTEGWANETATAAAGG
jgi:hypothetical protein